jgi:hypothetical protein
MCPITACGRSTSTVLGHQIGSPLCAGHWIQVPANLRAAMRRAWEALQADPGSAEKHAAYQAARDEAIASV